MERTAGQRDQATAAATRTRRTSTPTTSRWFVSTNTLKKGRIHWNFFPDQCRHCLEPPCEHEAAKLVDEAIIRDADTGAVIYTDKTKEISVDGFEDIRAVCPYDIPRRDPASGRIVKCTMCNERVVAGMLPACVKACPTGTMNFGERQKMLDLAQARLASLRKEYPQGAVGRCRRGRCDLPAHRCTQKLPQAQRGPAKSRPGPQDVPGQTRPAAAPKRGNAA